MKSKRNYGIDLLKIICMLMVVFLHLLKHGGILSNVNNNSFVYIMVWFIEILCFCAVNVYAIISGYLSVDKKYKFSNIINLYFRVIFYSLLITFIMTFFYKDLFIEVYFNSLFPVITKQYWFFSSYFIMFLFIPLINNSIISLNKKQYTLILTVLFILFSILQTLFKVDTFVLNGGYSPVWLIYMYLVGAYIKTFYKSKKNNSLKMYLFYLLMVILTLASKLLLERYDTIGIFKSNFLITYISPTIVLSSIFLFLSFKDLKIPNYFNNIVSKISISSFSVYLIHEHPLIRKFLIKNNFIKLLKYSPINMLLLLVLSALIIYLICIIIDFIREYIFNKLKISKLSLKINKLLD